MEKGNKKVIRGWVMYDWANSVYNLVISSAIFPIFYDNITTKLFLKENPHLNGVLPEGMDVLVNFFGWEVTNSALMSFVLSASFLVVAFLSPMLSGVADYVGNRKRFLQFFCYLGATSCITLYWFGKGPIELGMLSVFLASLGFWSSLVFYNAYLPEIAPVEDHDKISARGFTMGYFGAVILLIICLAIVMSNPKLTPYTFILVGLWWVGFSQITYRALPNTTKQGKVTRSVVSNGFKELKKVFVEFNKTKRLKRYLMSFFFFNTGVQTVMLLAVLFAKQEIAWPKGDNGTGLIISILLIQLLGALGAFIMSRLAGTIGNIKTLMISVTIWLTACFVAFFITTPIEFYGLAAVVGLVMGGVQAVARSTYSKYLPETEDMTSYFSFYDVTEKIGIVCGTLAFGLFEIIFGALRFSVISVGIFFFIGLILLFFIPRKEREVKNLTFKY